MEHRNIDYTVVEEEPGRWRWKIHLGVTAATVISDAQFPTREAAVAACLEEINNGLERSRQPETGPKRPTCPPRAKKAGARIQHDETFSKPKMDC